ncbi:MAG: prepilin peptidase [Anaerolineales bacterium]
MPLAFALLGWITGIVINLLSDQLPGRSALGAPRCDRCGAPRPAWAWSGMLGKLTAADRCVYCGTVRRARAAMVELGLAGGFLWLEAGHAPGRALVSALVLSVFVLFAVIDIEHRLVLHVVSLPAAAVMALVGVLDPARGPAKTLLGGAAGAAIVFLMYLGGIGFSRLMARWRGEELEEVAFGFGDVTLAAVVGLVVGWPGVIPALVVGVLSAGAYSALFLLASLLRRRYVAFTPIPYGPFLILGALTVYFGWFTEVVRAGSG